MGREADELERKVLLVVAHEMGGALQLLALQLAVLRERLRGQEAECLASMARAVERLRVLGRDLLDADHARSGRFAMSFAYHDVCGAIREELACFEDVALARGIVLALVAPDGGLVVRCDWRRLAQVLHNLVDNALKFSPTGGTVLVRAWRAGQDVVVSVTDSGPGIAPDHRQKIFEPRWQAPGESRGHGIGLYVARQIVEAHGGRIWVGDSVHDGTTISFSVPSRVGA